MQIVNFHWPTWIDFIGVGRSNGIDKLRSLLDHFFLTNERKKFDDHTLKLEPH